MASAGDQNRFLNSLPPADVARFLSRLEPVSLSYRQALHRPGEAIQHVYFPQGSLVSQIVVMEDGGALETGLVGKEGMVGVQSFLGSAIAPNLAMVQMAGDALQLGVEDFLAATRESQALRDLLFRYTVTLLNQTARVAACNRLHPVEERCARWLLMAQDRSGAEILPFTQEFLSLMLGVRRASVTTAATLLQRAGLIRYLRGSIEIVDRPGLELAACECYAVMRREVHMSFPD